MSSAHTSTSRGSAIVSYRGPGAGFYLLGAIGGSTWVATTRFPSAVPLTSLSRCGWAALKSCVWLNLAVPYSWTASEPTRSRLAQGTFENPKEEGRHERSAANEGEESSTAGIGTSYCLFTNDS